MRTPHARFGSTLLLLLTTGPLVHAQCGNDNTLYNVAATPPCPGSTTVACVFGGEYVLVNVVAGNTYTFSTCGATWDTQITLFNNTGGASLGYNDDGCGVQSTITWTATFTGQLRVLVDQWTLLVPCASNSTCAGLTVACTPGTPPVGDCVYVLNLYDSFGDGWGTSNVGISTNGGATFTYYSVTGSVNSIPIGVNIGQAVVLTYNNSGTFQTENSYSLTLGGASLFNSGSPPAAGISYAGTVTCNPPPAPPEDCVGSITICSGQTFNNTTNNTGNVADLTLTSAGCLGALERQGTWYNFSPSASGTVAFTLNPTDPLDDYDFAIWGPFPPGSTPSTICPPLGAPLRCSFAAPAGATGLNYTATDQTETASGDKWVQYINVTVGQVYLLYVSNYSQSGLEFGLTWNLGGGASLDCTQLAVQLGHLGATDHADAVQVDWTTHSELGSSHFVVERSADGVSFLPVGQVGAQGITNATTAYVYMDRSPLEGLSYYRLQQVDADGTAVPTHTVSVVHVGTVPTLLLVPNPSTGATTAHLSTPLDGALLVEVLDARGRILLQRRTTLAAGVTSFVMPTESLEPGTYGVRLTADGAPSSQAKLVIFR